MEDEQVAPEVKVPARRSYTRKAPEHKPEGLQMEDVMRFLAQMNADNQASMMEAIKEIRKPSELDQRKLDKEKDDELKRAAARVAAAQVEEEAKRTRMNGCSHSALHPGTGISKHMWRAQVHSPAKEKPYFIPTCTRCWTQLPKIFATPEMLTGGVNLDTYASLDLQTILRWASSAGVPGEAEKFRADHALAG